MELPVLPLNHDEIHRMFDVHHAAQFVGVIDGNVIIYHRIFMSTISKCIRDKIYTKMSESHIDILINAAENFIKIQTNEKLSNDEIDRTRFKFVVGRDGNIGASPRVVITKMKSKCCLDVQSTHNL